MSAHCEVATQNENSKHDKVMKCISTLLLLLEASSDRQPNSVHFDNAKVEELRELALLLLLPPMRRRRSRRCSPPLSF